MELSTYIQHGYIQTLQCEKSEMQKNALSDTIYTRFKNYKQNYYMLHGTDIQISGSIKWLKGTSKSQGKDWVGGEGSVNSVVCFLSFLNTGSVGLPGTNVKADLLTKKNLYWSFSNSS